MLTSYDVVILTTYTANKFIINFAKSLQPLLKSTLVSGIHRYGIMPTGTGSPLDTASLPLPKHSVSLHTTSYWANNYP
jgi:hypothetical protein